MRMLLGVMALAVAMPATAQVAAQDVTVPADAVVLSLGEKPNNALYNELKEKGVDVYVTGNAIRSGVIAPAMRTGYETARNLFVKKEEEFGFVATGPMLKKFISYSMMADQEGLYMLYMTDPDAIKKVLPAPLKPYRMPVVMISACTRPVLRSSVSGGRYVHPLLL